MNSIPELIEDIRQGKMVILMDDEDRENEGDLIMAANKVTPQAINFMARYGRGLICLTLNKARATQLRLPPMVRQNHEKYSTNFTVSIEAAEGVTTGISAADRAHTIQVAVANGAKPEDLVQPGHVFPLVAQPGGVLYRAGHTEASSDLARLAGLEPAAVIVEILNDDGTMARRPDLEQFAEQHQLKMGTIADLIRYRLEEEHTVERVAESEVESDFGHFHLLSYLDSSDHSLHYALVKGQIDPEKPTLVRVHLEDQLSDLLGIHQWPRSWSLSDAMRHIAEEGTGVLVLLGQKETTQDVIKRIAGWQQAASQRASESDETEELRMIGAGSQILAELGVKKMRVMSAPKKIHALSGFGLEVVDYVPSPGGR